MEEKTMMPINNQIEPDFLEHIKSTFKRWRDLNTQGVTIGARELSNFAFTLKGASMNSHLGFKYNFNPRGTDTDGNPAITLKLYTKSFYLTMTSKGTQAAYLMRTREKQKARRQQY